MPSSSFYAGCSALAKDFSCYIAILSVNSRSCIPILLFSKVLRPRNGKAEKYYLASIDTLLSPTLHASQAKRTAKRGPAPHTNLLHLAKAVISKRTTKNIPKATGKALESSDPGVKNADSLEHDDEKGLREAEERFDGYWKAHERGDGTV